MEYDADRDHANRSGTTRCRDGGFRLAGCHKETGVEHQKSERASIDCKLRVYWQGRQSFHECIEKWVCLFCLTGDSTQILMRIYFRTTMRLAVSPLVTIAAITTSGQNLYGSLTDCTVSFVTGYFTDRAIAAATAIGGPAAVSVTTTDTPFVMPGVALEFFPVGLVVAGVWTLILLLVVGTGAWSKAKSRGIRKDISIRPEHRGRRCGFGVVRT